MREQLEISEDLPEALAHDDTVHDVREDLERATGIVGLSVPA